MCVVAIAMEADTADLKGARGAMVARNLKNGRHVGLAKGAARSRTTAKRRVQSAAAGGCSNANVVEERASHIDMGQKTALRYDT